MYLVRSEGHLSGCDTARLLLDRLAGCGQWQGAHAAGGRAAIGHDEEEHLLLPPSSWNLVAVVGWA